MNKLSLYVLFAAILPFLAGTLQGAEPECAQPGAGTSWTVTISRAKKQPAEARPADQEAAAEEKVDMPVLLSVQTGRNGISLGKITYKSGKTESFYAANGKVLVTATNSGKVLTIPQDVLNPLSLRGSIFPGTAWISKKFERRTELKDKIPCLYYYYEELIGDKPSIRIEAWVRQADRIPVEVIIENDTVYRYGEITPFAEDIILPSPYQNALARLQFKQSAMDQLMRANARQAK